MGTGKFPTADPKIRESLLEEVIHLGHCQQSTAEAGNQVGLEERGGWGGGGAQWCSTGLECQDKELDFI